MGRDPRDPRDERRSNHSRSQRDSPSRVKNEYDRQRRSHSREFYRGEERRDRRRDSRER